MQLDNGLWGVVDFECEGFSLISAGQSESQAKELADRLNLRVAIGA